MLGRETLGVVGLIYHGIASAYLALHPAEMLIHFCCMKESISFYLIYLPPSFPFTPALLGKILHSYHPFINSTNRKGASYSPQALF